MFILHILFHFKLGMKWVKHNQFLGYQKNVIHVVILDEYCLRVPHLQNCRMMFPALLKIPYTLRDSLII